jgi:hypothetical protein
LAGQLPASTLTQWVARSGLFQPTHKTVAAAQKTNRPKTRSGAWDVGLLQRAVSVIQTKRGVRALVKGKAVDPADVERKLRSKFGDVLESVELPMRVLARFRPLARLAVEAYALYESFRPEIPAGTAGCGAAGALELKRLHARARPAPRVSGTATGNPRLGGTRKPRRATARARTLRR